MTTALAMHPSNRAAPLLSIAPDFDQQAAQALDDVIGKGDLSKMSPAQRVNYYRRTCESVGLNPLTQPFEYVTFQGKMVLYARKGCTDQLREIKNVSIPKHLITREYDPDTGIYTVEATAVLPDGREDTDIGAVFAKNLSGEALANAYKKAITQAKRRVTLAICGLGWLDESEVDSVPNAKRINVDMETGEIIEPNASALPPERFSDEWSVIYQGIQENYEASKQPGCEELRRRYNKVFCIVLGMRKISSADKQDLKQIAAGMLSAEKEVSAMIEAAKMFESSEGADLAASKASRVIEAQVIEAQVIEAETVSEVKAVEVASEDDPFSDSFIDGDARIVGQN